MAQYTSLIYYRPTKPPIVTASDLATFLLNIDKLDLCTGEAFKLEILYGNEIEVELEDNTEEVISSTEFVTMSVLSPDDTEWDIEFDDFSKVKDLLSNSNRICRAHATFEWLKDDFRTIITKEYNEESNDDGYYHPDSLSVDIGPVKLDNGDLEDELTFGWLSINMHGWGMIESWTTLKDLVKRMNAKKEYKELMSLCETTWPVEATEPEIELRAMRKFMDSCWPYDSIDLPTCWAWGMHQSF